VTEELFPDTGSRPAYLCGAGTHPGGEVTGAPGHNAARAILADPLRDVAAGPASAENRAPVWEVSSSAPPASSSVPSLTADPLTRPERAGRRVSPARQPVTPGRRRDRA
jgi:hypothetical protein